eukprot:TRINITY_DN15397_c0_g1_i2.p1 TRINITY_DN15397_c0_g1~~TRINITY_DN15397_c0_g1_i2.p1  ORF type:complete len:226 (+),score=42.91 TRINITY_DN15397_c0_g1_i2:55-732(+)
MELVRIRVRCASGTHTVPSPAETSVSALKQLLITNGLPLQLPCELLRGHPPTLLPDGPLQLSSGDVLTVDATETSAAGPESENAPVPLSTTPEEQPAQSALEPEPVEPEESQQSDPAQEGQDCCICLEVARDAVVVVAADRLSSCEHAFCRECLGRWAHYKRSCPMCKRDFKFCRAAHAGAPLEEVVAQQPPLVQQLLQPAQNPLSTAMLVLGAAMLGYIVLGGS